MKHRIDREMSECSHALRAVVADFETKFETSRGGGSSLSAVNPHCTSLKLMWLRLKESIFIV